MAALRSISLPRMHTRITVGPREQAAVVMVTMTLAYCLSRYHWVAGSWTWTSVFYFFFVPLAIALVLRAKPSQWGLGIGELRMTLGFTAAGLAAAALLLAVSHNLPTMQAFYRPLRPSSESLGSWALLLVIEMLAWEFFWRGFGLFGLEPALGRLAVFVPMIPFALAHLHKPEIETLTSIIGAIVLGFVVLKCRSIWPAFIVHYCFYAAVFFI